jgi:hypothetical protein
MQHEAQRTPSWMISLGTTRLKWQIKIKKNNFRYSVGNLLLQDNAIWTKKHCGHLSKGNGSSV